MAKLVHKMCVFIDEDIEWVFDLQLDRFESSEDESCGDVFSDDSDNELVEVDDVSLSLVFWKPLEPRVGSGFLFLFQM